MVDLPTPPLPEPTAITLRMRACGVSPFWTWLTWGRRGELFTTGTGDIQLTLTQKIPLAGAVIVTTPQDIATLDAKKALKMFEKVEVPVLGIVENMAVHTCSSCGHIEHLFGEGGGERMAAQYGVPLLGSLPLQIGIREQGDAGTPITVAQPDSAPAQAYRHAAQRLIEEVGRRPRASIPILSSLL